MMILIALPTLLIIVVTVIARFEKRMVWPYGQPEIQPQFSDATGYGSRWVADARQAGFTFLGWAPDLKGARYRVSYGFLTSPEQDCLVIVGVGAVVSMPVRGTWIYSRGLDGKVFYTTDNQSCISIDGSRRWRTQLVRTNSFAELLRRHRGLIRDYGITPVPFSVGREVEEFRSMREEHYLDMSRRGLIVFMDASATHWHYTFWGALKFSVLNHAIGLLRGLTFGRIPRCA